MIISLIIVDKEETRVGRKGAERGREKREQSGKGMWEREGKEREKEKKYEMKMGAKQMVNWFQLLPWLTVIAIDASVATATANRSWTTPSPLVSSWTYSMLSLVF